MWCITTFFNPAGYQKPIDNYRIFADNLHRQGATLLTLEVAFGDAPFCLADAVHLRSSSVLWLKERLINYGISLLPNHCKEFAWLDADVLFAKDDWTTLAKTALATYDVVQLFRRVFYLPKGHNCYQGIFAATCQGIVYQRNISPNWHEQRRTNHLPFAAPGFAWAARKDAFSLYDRDVVGSNDCVFVDCLLDSWDFHGYQEKFNDKMKLDIQEYRKRLPKLKVGCISGDLFHLWHGQLEDRQYKTRHEITTDYDPYTDIRIDGPLYVWSSNKPDLHAAVNSYFHIRREDN